MMATRIPLFDSLNIEITVADAGYIVMVTWCKILSTRKFID